jgi:hypothetical protein
MSKQVRVKVRLLFVDEGSYHHEDVEISSDALDGYARLIDCVREDEAVQKRLYVDAERLCSAWVIEE